MPSLPRICKLVVAEGQTVTTALSKSHLVEAETILRDSGSINKNNEQHATTETVEVNKCCHKKAYVTVLQDPAAPFIEYIAKLIRKRAGKP